MNEPKDIEMSFGEVNLNNWRSLRSQLFRHGGICIEKKCKNSKLYEPNRMLKNGTKMRSEHVRY